MRSSLLIAVVLALLPGAARGSTLALIQSKSLGPYDRAAHSFEASLGQAVQHFDLAARPEDEIVRDIRQLSPALVVAVGTEALRVANERLGDLPMVYLMVLEAQPASSRRAPSTGVTLEIPGAAQIQALKALRPNLKTLGVLYDPSESGLAVARLSEAAERAGLTLVTRAATSTREAMAAMPQLFEHCDAYIVVPDRTTGNDPCFELAVLMSLRHHVLLFAPSRKYVEKGALAALGATYEDVGAQAAAIALRLLAGKPAPEPEAPRMLDLIVNGKIAGKFGISIPRRYQGRAVEVLE